jgi:hypothetical protein
LLRHPGLGLDPLQWLGLSARSFLDGCDGVVAEQVGHAPCFGGCGTSVPGQPIVTMYQVIAEVLGTYIVEEAVLKFRQIGQDL